MNIQEKAVITRFNVSAWTARRYDKKVTQKIENEYNARDAGRFNKVLIAEDAIKAYQGIAGEKMNFDDSVHKSGKGAVKKDLINNNGLSIISITH